MKVNKVDVQRDFSDILASSDWFRNRGITFRLGTTKDWQQIRKFLVEEFFPDEPIFRSFRIGEEGYWFSDLVLAFTDYDVRRKCLKSKNGYSVLAVDSRGDIVGVKLGYRATSDKRMGHLVYYPIFNRLSWVIPKVIVDFNTASYHNEVELGYHPNRVMDELKVKSCFDGLILGVARRARGLRIGKEMVKMSMAIARDLECDVYFACLSGIYSQKIYQDLGFTTVREVHYSDIRDSDGNIILKDTREHTKERLSYWIF